MPASLTKENYQYHIDEYQAEMRRYEGRPGVEEQLALYAEGIGNVYREFERPESREWYKRALHLLRMRSHEPSIRTAFLYGKWGT